MNSPHLRYGLISLACPFIAFIVASICLMLVFTDYWHPIEKGLIGVLTALGVLIGCLVGMVFAIWSLKHRTRLFSLGTAALLFNAIPIVAAVSLTVLQVLL
jgi:hypothetical protein